MLTSIGYLKVNETYYTLIPQLFHYNYIDKDSWNNSYIKLNETSKKSNSYFGCGMRGKDITFIFYNEVFIKETTRLWPYILEHTRLCPETFVPTHVCAQTRLCPDTFVPRHVCAQTRLCPHTFVPTHVCAHTFLCPDTFVPWHVIIVW